MTRTISTIVAAVVALGTLVAAVQPAEAGRKGRFLTGLAVGAIGTAIVANEVRRSRERRYYNERVIVRERPVYVDGHAARCARKYRSYDARTDTFVGYDGRVRRCRLY